MANKTNSDWSFVIRKNMRLLLAAALVSGLAGLVFSFVVPKTYQSGLVLKIGRVSYASTRSSSKDVTTNDIETVAAVQDLIKSEPFMTEVIGRLKLDTTPEKLLKKIKVKINLDAKSEEQNNQVFITTKAKTPELAAKLAGAIAGLVIERHARLYDQAVQVQYEYEKKLDEQIISIGADLADMKSTLKKLYKNPQVGTPAVLLLQAAVKDKERDLADLKRELGQARLIGHTRLRSENTSLVAPPYTPTVPVSPKPLLDILAGLFIGLAAAIVYAFYKEPGNQGGA